MWLIMAGLLLLMPAGTLRAQDQAIPTGEPAAAEICVRCLGPERAYRCRLDGTHDARRAGFICAARIAKEEAHDTCAVVRQQTGCTGDLRQYADDGGQDLDTGAPLAAASAPETVEPEPAQTPTEGPPGTLVDLTRQSAKQTERALGEAAEKTGEAARSLGETVRDAGTAVGRAARKTIKCLGSGLQKC
jgi:hypothetical protein